MKNILNSLFYKKIGNFILIAIFRNNLKRYNNYDILLNLKPYIIQKGCKKVKSNNGK